MSAAGVVFSFWCEGPKYSRMSSSDTSTKSRLSNKVDEALPLVFASSRLMRSLNNVLASTGCEDGCTEPALRGSEVDEAEDRRERPPLDAAAIDDASLIFHEYGLYWGS